MSAIQTAHPTSDLQQLIRMIEAEYEEMPGLALTASQAERLWHADHETCGAALETLTAFGFLRRTGNRYVAGRVARLLPKHTPVLSR